MLVSAARFASLVVLSAASGSAGFSQVPSSGLGWGADFTAAKAALPKSQDEANTMPWGQVWGTFKTVVTERGWGPSNAVPAKFAKYAAIGWTFQENKPVQFNAITGLAYSAKSGLDPTSRTQSGPDRFTKYVSAKCEATFSTADLLSVSYVYRGKSTQDTSGADAADSFDQLIIHAKPNAFEMAEKIDEFENVLAGGTYTWQNVGTKSDTIPVGDLHLPVIGLTENELKGAGYLLVRILNGNGAKGLILASGH